GQRGAPFAIAAASLAGLGLAWLGRFAGPRAGVAAAAAAGVILIAGPAMVTWPAVSPAAAGDAPRRFAEAALDETPPRGLLLTRSESLSGLLLYLSTVEGARPDVAPLERARLDDQERSRAIAGAALDSASLAGPRPIAWELGGERPPPAIEMRSVVGLLGRSPGESDISRAAGRVAAIFSGPGGGDPIAQGTAARVLADLRRLARARRDHQIFTRWSGAR
ncbi:MAG TPA: hypothetical protein VNO33_03680, partial [Kofleriaceae bacterium]|nr:hypothetical protein [Kofleriaceae bacterium]